MKFDASRAESFFRELGDPLYAGADGEAKVAALVASRFAAMGLDVELPEVSGSRFPQRVAPWVGWVGYGLLLTTVYLLLRRADLLSSILGFVLAYLSIHWPNAVVEGRFRPGRGRPPLEVAPLVIATLHEGRPSSVRVVFQAVLGGLGAGDLVAAPRRFWYVFALWVVTWPLFLWLVGHRVFLIVYSGEPGSNTLYAHLMRYVYPVFLATVWVGIALLLLAAHRRSRERAGHVVIDRHGLAVLLELARSWPRSGSRPIEPVFVAAGGHRLDFAGSRAVLRRLRSEWSGKPSLLVLLFAPGAGNDAGLFTVDPAPALSRLVFGAAEDLWIPIRGDQPAISISSWPFYEGFHPVVGITGTDPRALDADDVDPQALHRAGQLAAEIALRWAKRLQVTAPSPDSAN